MPTRHSELSAGHTLHEHARATLGPIQRALAEILKAMRVEPSRPRDLSRRLAVHQTLAWKVCRIASSQDLFADVQHLPGRDGIDKVLLAAAECGVPDPVVSAVRAAYLDFQHLVAAHAGDRASLEQMLGGLAKDAEAQSDNRMFRRSGFRCASSTWGTQIRVRLLSKVLHPSSRPGLMDIALVRGFVGMRRVRPGAPITLARVVVLDNDGKARRAVASAPIEPDGVHEGVPLLREFCSDPLPQLRTAPGPDGVLEQQLGEAPVGELSAATVFSGEVQYAAVSRYRDDHNLVSNTAVAIRAPIQTLVIDVWAHRDLFDPASPCPLLFGEMSGTPWYKQLASSAERLPISEKVRTLGFGLARARLNDAPMYVEVMRSVFQRLHWAAEEFELHRLRIEYPVMGTAAVVQFPLPGAPG